MNWITKLNKRTSSKCEHITPENFFMKASAVKLPKICWKQLSVHELQKKDIFIGNLQKMVGEAEKWWVITGHWPSLAAL